MYFFEHTNYWRKSVAAGLTKCMRQSKLLHSGHHELVLSMFHQYSIKDVALPLSPVTLRPELETSCEDRNNTSSMRSNMFKARNQEQLLSTQETRPSTSVNQKTITLYTRPERRYHPITNSMLKTTQKQNSETRPCPRLGTPISRSRCARRPP